MATGYSVRQFFLHSTSGAQAPTLVEQRVMLVFAESFDDAIAKAEKYAADYAAGGPRIINQKGESISLRFLGYSDAFELDELVDGAELHSCTTIHAGPLEPESIIDRFSGDSSEKDHDTISEHFEPDIERMLGSESG